MTGKAFVAKHGGIFASWLQDNTVVSMKHAMGDTPPWLSPETAKNMWLEVMKAKAAFKAPTEEGCLAFDSFERELGNDVTFKLMRRCVNAALCIVHTSRCALSFVAGNKAEGDLHTHYFRFPKAPWATSTS